MDRSSIARLPDDWWQSAATRGYDPQEVAMQAAAYGWEIPQPAKVEPVVLVYDWADAWSSVRAGHVSPPVLHAVLWVAVVYLAVWLWLPRGVKVNMGKGPFFEFPGNSERRAIGGESSSELQSHIGEEKDDS